ncbi:MAG: thiamine pyrophosphate-binding protein, partial [Candidatus Puniceispirillum sp.]
QERPFDLTPQAPARSWPEPSRLQLVLDKLAAASRPVLIGGHGVWWSGAEDSLEEAGRLLGIPVFNVPYHQKLLGEECEAYMGLADIHQYHPSADAFHESDLVLMVGARLDNQMNFGN